MKQLKQLWSNSVGCVHLWRHVTWRDINRLCILPNNTHPSLLIRSQHHSHSNSTPFHTKSKPSICSTLTWTWRILNFKTSLSLPLKIIMQIYDNLFFFLSFNGARGRPGKSWQYRKTNGCWPRFSEIWKALELSWAPSIYSPKCHVNQMKVFQHEIYQKSFWLSFNASMHHLILYKSVTLSDAIHWMMNK